MLELIASLPILPFHITAVFTTLGLVVIADSHGLLWLLGKLPVLPQKRMALFHKLIWAGLIMIIISGAGMFTIYSDYLLRLPVFFIKMGFVTALLVNAFFIGRFTHLAFEHRFADLEPKQKRILLISGFVSTISWIGAFTAAKFLGL